LSRPADALGGEGYRVPAHDVMSSSVELVSFVGPRS